MIATVSEQLLLSHIRARPDARLADFAGETYASIVAAGRAFVTSPHGLMYVHGRPGSGRSHFLAALCAEAEASGLQTVLLPLSEVVKESPEALAGLERADLVVLDDLQVIAGKKDWEEAIFHFFNRCRAERNRMILSADGTPSQASIWGLGVPDDASREALIVSAASRRGWVLELDVLHYLVVRAPREPEALLAFLESLDHRSLQESRKLTIPFVRESLDLPTDRGGG